MRERCRFEKTLDVEILAVDVMEVEVEAKFDEIDTTPKFKYTASDL